MTQTLSEKSRIRKTLYQNLRRKYGLVPRELLDLLVPLRLEEKRLIVEFMSEHNEAEKPSLPDIKVSIVPQPSNEEIWLLKDSPKRDEDIEKMKREMKEILLPEPKDEPIEKDAVYQEFLGEEAEPVESSPKNQCQVCGSPTLNNAELCGSCYGNYEWDRITRKYVKR